MAEDSARKTERQSGSGNFSPGATALSCPDCGYPLKPADAECPNCGRGRAQGEDKKRKEKPDPEKPPKPDIFKRTKVHSSEGGDALPGGEERRKLTGFLVTYGISPNGIFFPIYEGRNTLGSDPSNDIVLPVDSVSGKHLEIAYYGQNKKFYFETVGLTQNGTYVNDTFYPKGGDELKNLDVITIGSARLTFMAIPEAAFVPFSNIGKNQG
jgi:uncharacterized Zn finger protein (UPF0148 family)